MEPPKMARIGDFRAAGLIDSGLNAVALSVTPCCVNCFTQGNSPGSGDASISALANAPNATPRHYLAYGTPVSAPSKSI
jgi:hypothetical protein